MKLAAVVLLGLLVALSAAQDCKITEGHDISLDNIASYNQRPDRSQCCSLCAGHAGCGGWAWNNYEGGTCWLKGGSGPLVPADGVSAGTPGGGGGGKSTGYFRPYAGQR